MSINLQVGKTYRIAGGDKATVVGEYDGNFVGVIETFADFPIMWKSNGFTVNSHSDFDIIKEIDEARETWDKLHTSDRDAIQRLVIAFIDKKITGIRYLRAGHGLSLLIAKNIFENVAARAYPMR